MERLTIDTKMLFCDIAQCSETPGGSYCEDGYCDQRRVYERLREYERKGLAPEDAPSLTERVKVHSAIRLLKQYEALGSISDLTTLVKARDDERFAVLPCKLGDTVWTNFAMSGWYFRDKDKPYSAKVAFVGLNDSEEMGGGLLNIVYGKHHHMMQFRFSDFGKTVFLTRAEAEAALKGAVDHEAD